MRIEPHKKNLQHFYPKNQLIFLQVSWSGYYGKRACLHSSVILEKFNSMSRDWRGEGREESEFSLLCYKAEESMERWRSHSETRNPVLCLSTALSYGGWGGRRAFTESSIFHGRELLRLLQLPLLDSVGKSFQRRPSASCGRLFYLHH